MSAAGESVSAAGDSVSAVKCVFGDTGMGTGGGVSVDPAAARSDAGLYKLVRLGNNGAMHAPSDVEVARIEASFMGPDLPDSERDLLRIGGDEEEERQALLERMQAYDLVLSSIEHSQQQQEAGEEPAMAGSIADLFNVVTTSGKLPAGFDSQVCRPPLPISQSRSLFVFLATSHPQCHCQRHPRQQRLCSAVLREC